MVYFSELLLLRDNFVWRPVFCFSQNIFWIVCSFVVNFLGFLPRTSKSWRLSETHVFGMVFTYPKVSFPPAQSLYQYLVPLTLHISSRSWTEAAKAFWSMIPTRTTGITPSTENYADYFSLFQWALHYQVRFFPPLMPSHSLQRKYHGIFFPEEHVWFHTYWKLPTQVLSFPLHARNGVNMPRGIRCALLYVLSENCEGTTKAELWNKQATAAATCNWKPKCFPSVHHQIRILPRAGPSHNMSQLPAERWTVGEGICAEFSVNKERGFKLLKFLSCEFCFLF